MLPRYATPRLLLILLITFTAGAAPLAHAQDRTASTHADETVRLTRVDGTTVDATGGVTCPGDVFVGQVPQRIEVTVSTTSEADIDYFAEYRYTNATLSATTTAAVTEVMDSDTTETSLSFASSDSNGMTTRRLDTFINNRRSLFFEIEATAIAPGPTQTHFMTSFTGEETCEFNVLAPTHTLTVNSVPSDVPLEVVVNGQAETVTTPHSRSVEENAQVALTAPNSFDGEPFTEWRNGVTTTDPQLEFTMTSDVTATAVYGTPPEADVTIELVAVDGGVLGKQAARSADDTVRLPLDAEAVLRFLLQNLGPDPAGVNLTGSFGTGLLSVLEVAVAGGSCGGSGGTVTCTIPSIPPGEDREMAVTVQTGPSEGTIDASVSAVVQPPPVDPNGANNTVDINMEILEDLEVSGSIHGQVYEERFNAGEHNLGDIIGGLHVNGEPGVNDLRVFLRQDGVRVDSTVTMNMDLNGDGVIDHVTERGLYWFDDVSEGDYTVRVSEVSTDGESAYCVEEEDPCDTGPRSVSVQAGSRIEEVDFFVVPELPSPGIEDPIVGEKFEDLDGDGVRDPDEEGLEDVVIAVEDVATGRIYLISTDMNGQFDTGLLRGHRYRVREIVPEGFAKTTPPDGFELTVNTGSGIFSSLPTFGNVRLAGRALIRGRVFFDCDTPLGPCGLDNVTVEVVDQGGSVVATTTTHAVDVNADGVFGSARSPSDLAGLGEDELGFYSVVVDPGTYTVRLAQEDGLSVIFPASGDHFMVLQPGEVKEEVDFEIFPTNDVFFRAQSINASGETLDLSLDDARVADDLEPGTATGFGTYLRGASMEVFVPESSDPAASTTLDVQGAAGLIVASDDPGGTAGDIMLAIRDDAHTEANDPNQTDITFYNGLQETIDIATRDGDPQIISVSPSQFSEYVAVDQGQGGTITVEALDPATGTQIDAFSFPEQPGEALVAVIQETVSGKQQRLRMLLFSASGEPVEPAVVTATAGVDLPADFVLHANYPNPFNPTTTLRFDLPQPAEVRVAVYDLLGQRVLTLPPQTFAPGTGHILVLDASALSSGVYLYRLTAGGAAQTYRATGRFVLLK